jgi:hypothetical protein
MPLPRRSFVSDWRAPIIEADKKEMRGVISIHVSGDAPDSYDPFQDSGGRRSKRYLVENRAARIQHLRAPADASTDDQWQMKRSFRFKIELLPGDPVIPQGAIVRVIDGGEDPTLVAYQFTVTSAVNSSSAATRTIEAVSEMRPAK